MNIYVGNFDTAWTDDNLKQLFLSYGNVHSARVMMDSFTDLSRGFGYVEMDDQEATTAIQTLNESEQDGRKLTVKQADPKEERKGSYKVGNGGINPYRFKKN